MSNETATLVRPVEPEKIQWTTPKEMEQYERMLDKNFVKVDDKGEPDSKSKKFFYTLTGMHPYCPKGVTASADNFKVAFQVQKFHRNEFVEVNQQTPQGVRSSKRNKQCFKHELNDSGNWVVVDEDADFHMDAKEFLKKFKQEYAGGWLSYP